VLTLPDGSTIDVQKKDINVIVDGVQVKYNKGVLSYRPTVTTQQHEERNVDRKSGEVQMNWLYHGEERILSFLLMEPLFI